MARATGTPARTQRLIAVLAICLLAAATAVALGRVFIGPAATQRLLLAALVSGLLACACEKRNLALAAAVSAIGLLVAVGILIFPHTTWHGVPTMDTLRAIVDASKLVGQQARLQVSPTPPLQPLMLAALTATWAAIFSAHALAFRAGSPLLALLPPVALVAFADTVLDDAARPLYGVWFLIAALVVVFADGIRRMQAWGPVWAGSKEGTRLTRTAGRGARRVAFAAVSVALVAPLLIPGFGSKALIDLSGQSHPGVNVDLLVSVASELKQGDNIEAFTVQTDEPTYYRVLALTDFDGTIWRQDPNPQTQDAASGQPLGPIPGLDPAAVSGTPSITQHFHVVNQLQQPYVPSSYPAVSVDIDESMHWDDGTGAISLNSSIDGGTDFTVTSLKLQPTPDQLRALGTPAPPADPGSVETPLGMSPLISERALDWTQGASTMYDRVLAIQNHLLDPLSFTYDTTVPAVEGSTAMVNFLYHSHRGFCQQFSSAMALLLRSIGIPARVAVGYTAGKQDAHALNTWHVTTDNLHAWVEVLFPTYGWLAFEPTPGRTNPVAVEYAQPGTGTDGTGGNDGPKAHPTATPSPPTGKNGQIVEPPPRADAPPVDVGTIAVEGTSRFSARRILVAGLLIALVVFLLVPVVRAGRRRIRLRRAASSPRALILTTYDVFTERAGELGYGRASGETLDEYRARVAASGLLRDGDLDRLTRITSQAAYASGSPGKEDARTATSAAATTLRDIKRGTPLLTRVRGRYLPDR